MKSLNVYYENQLVGLLSQTEDLTYGFSYENSWLQNPLAFPLSIAMPLSQKEYTNKITLSFFENLIPEGQVRKSLEHTYHIQGPFGFLKKFGQDCAGAIVVTDQKNYKFQNKPDQMKLLNMDNVYSAISDHESVAEAISENNPGYLSLAGAQDKFPAIYKNKKYYIPTHGSATTHIVKAPIWKSGIRESVYNEHYCMQLAGIVGLSVPVNFVVEDAPHPLYIIERYDRQIDQKGVIHRIHQQDFCQAHGLSSESKYESHGGPSLKANYDLIMTHVAVKKRAAALNQFMDWVCFNLLIGNNDCHSKNISLVLRDGKIELAPFYDLLSTALYTKLTKKFSFKIGNRELFHEIGKNQFTDLEKAIGMKPGTWIERFRTMNDKIISVKDQVTHELLKKHPKVKVFARISELISERSKGLKSQKTF